MSSNGPLTQSLSEQSAIKATATLEADGIAKRFGAVEVLKEVNLSLYKGEVLGLVGDNGAGKSTFIKVLTGFHPPDSGRLVFEGKPIHLASTTEARHRG